MSLFKTSLFGSSCLALLFLSASCGPRPVAAVIREMRFSEMIPPSTATPAGTIVLEIDDGTLETVCEQAQALGPKADTLVTESKSITKEQENKLTATLKLGVDALKSLKAEVGADSIEDIKLSLSGAKIYTVSWASASQGLKDSIAANMGCKENIDQAMSQKDKQGKPLQPRMISQVLKADVTYTIQYKRGASAGVVLPKEVLQYLGITADASVGSSGSDKVSGTGLYWGYRIMHREMNTKRMGTTPDEIVENLMVDMSDEAPRLMGMSRVKKFVPATASGTH